MAVAAVAHFSAGAVLKQLLLLDSAESKGLSIFHAIDAAAGSDARVSAHLQEVKQLSIKVEHWGT